MPPIDPRIADPIQNILDALEGCAAHPDNWREAGAVDYLYRRDTLLVRTTDADPVAEAVRRLLARDGAAVTGIGIEPNDRFPALSRVTLPAGGRPLPELMDDLDQAVGAGTAKLDHVFVVSGHACPATEPEEPPPGLQAPRPPLRQDPCPQPPAGPARRCDGHGVRVDVVDTGWLPSATRWNWLATGVNGDEEDPYDAQMQIREFAGHGTFSAGCVRVTAPAAEVYVHAALTTSGAAYEWDLATALHQVLAGDPKIVIFCWAADTREELSPMSLDVVFETDIRERDDVVFLAPAGNAGAPQRRFPAGYKWVVGVGALAEDLGSRAGFSNHGDWVDVYAPGTNLVNAFADGTYTCLWSPHQGEVRHFTGLAQWSGTSFATPLVAGLIAARVSATGEDAPSAARHLLRIARHQALAGVGPVLGADQGVSGP